MQNGINFFDFLKNEKLIFDVKTVENFLLSVKTKQFIILSGCSGTGKTKLAQAYGKYISGVETSNKIVKSATTINRIAKDDQNISFTFEKRTDVFSALPKEVSESEGDYYFTINGVRAKGRMTLTPRIMSVIENGAELKSALKKQLPDSTDDTTETKKRVKADVYLEIPGDNPGDQNRYEIVPVGANWTESRFILGYKNAISKQYVSNPSYKLLRSASNNKETPFVLILDEMNLSHVERYFADILSAMESREPIILDDDEKTELRIHDNVLIIGTVNQDETTYDFSPKVLDRANVIEFNPLQASDMLSGQIHGDKPAGDIDYLGDCDNYKLVRSKTAHEIVEEITSIKDNERVINALTNDLDNIQSKLKDIGFSFGFRTVNEIMRFMFAAWNYERKGVFNNWKRYFDAQIIQKILPKIHGNLSIRSTLDELRIICENKYPTAQAKLEKMIRVLDSQRYVSFNC